LDAQAAGSVGKTLAIISQPPPEVYQTMPCEAGHRDRVLEQQLRQRTCRLADKNLAMVNDQLWVKKPLDLFVTMRLGSVNPATDQPEYANGGHNPAWLRQADGPTTWLGPTGDMPLGVMSGLPDSTAARARYRVEQVFRDVARFADGAPQSHDITSAALTWEGETS
jgi:hypothetical protein